MQVDLPIEDRRSAGRLLAKALHGLAQQDVLVLALPRGGVPVAYEIARVLEAELDVLLVRKLGIPGQREFALGAIASGGVRVLNRDAVETLQVSDALIDSIASREQKELERREVAYRGRRERPRVAGRTVVLVDDGLATGSTMLAAVVALRRSRPGRILVAVPLGARRNVEALRREVDEVVCLASPEPFLAIGPWYREFGQVSDEEVRALLDADDVGVGVTESSN